jgi:hypothetical protein
MRRERDVGVAACTLAAIQQAVQGEVRPRRAYQQQRRGQHNAALAEAERQPQEPQP